MNVLMYELFQTPIGWLTLFTIGFVVVIGAWIFNFVRVNVARDEARHAKEIQRLES